MDTFKLEAAAWVHGGLIVVLARSKLVSSISRFYHGSSPCD